MVTTGGAPWAPPVWPLLRSRTSYSSGGSVPQTWRFPPPSAAYLLLRSTFGGDRFDIAGLRPPGFDIAGHSLREGSGGKGEARGPASILSLRPELIPRRTSRSLGSRLTDARFARDGAFGSEDTIAGRPLRGGNGFGLQHL